MCRLSCLYSWKLRREKEADMPIDFEKLYDDFENDADYQFEGLYLQAVKNIVDRMEQLGMKPADLARELKTSRAFVSKVLNGEASNMQLKTLARMAIALDSNWHFTLARKEDGVRWFHVISNKKNMPSNSAAYAVVSKTPKESYSGKVAVNC